MKIYYLPKLLDIMFSSRINPPRQSRQTSPGTGMAQSVQKIQIDSFGIMRGKKNKIGST
jgi:hypothetical protein